MRLLFTSWCRSGPDIPDETARQRVEATVANAVLRLKADIFTAIEAHKLLRWSPGHDLFTANRRYAVTARKVMRSPGDEGALLELEDALFQREDIERCALERDPAMSRFAREIQRIVPLAERCLGGSRLEVVCSARQVCDPIRRFSQLPRTSGA